MKRYMLFAGSTFYPAGGMDDYIESYDTIEEAINCFEAGYTETETYEVDAKGDPIWDEELEGSGTIHSKTYQYYYDWCHVYDRVSGTVVVRKHRN